MEKEKFCNCPECLLYGHNFPHGCKFSMDDVAPEMLNQALWAMEEYSCKNPEILECFLNDEEAAKLFKRIEECLG